MTDTLTTPELADTDLDGKKSHYAPRAEVMRGMIEGAEIVALCGKRFVPFDNPDRYPFCPVCVERREELRRLEGK